MNSPIKNKNVFFNLKLFMVFTVGFIVFFTGRSYIAVDYFGGDLHSVAIPDSYNFNTSNIKNEPAFYSKLYESSLNDTTYTPCSFIYKLLPEKGRKSLENLTKGMGNEREKNSFIYDFNNSVVDSAIAWPPVLLKELGIDQSSFNKMTPPKQNLHFINKAFPEETNISFLESPSLWQSIRNIPGVAKMYFTLKDPTRYTPVSNVYIHTMQYYLSENSEKAVVGIFFMSIFFGLSLLLMTLLAYELMGSIYWAALASFVLHTTMAVLCSSYMLFSLPYIFVNIFSFAAFISYLRFRKNGEKKWLASFAFIAIICPWVREFSAAVPYIVFLTEIFTFGRKRSFAVLFVCIPLMLHSLAPSFLPKIIGLNSGDVYSVFSMGKTKFHLQGNLNFRWDIMGQVFVQFAPVLWILTTWSILFWSLRSRRIIGKIFSKTLFITIVFSAATFILSFYIYNKSLEHFIYMKYGLFLALFTASLCLVSFRFGSFLPIYFAIMIMPSIRMGIAEVHLAFSIPPLIMIIVLWFRNLWIYINDFCMGTRKKIYVSVFIVLLSIGIIDHISNAVSCCLVQKSLVKTNKEAALWIKNNVPRHSIMLTNYFNFIDMYKYSGCYFDPYESVENCPAGPQKVIHKDEDFKKLIENNYGIRDVYFIAAEHKFFSWQEGYHSHKFVRTPAGNLEKKVIITANPLFYYFDPFKFFTPRYWISFPGYMDWNTDFWWDNLPRMFTRYVNCEYVFYELTDPNVLKESVIGNTTETNIKIPVVKPIPDDMLGPNISVGSAISGGDYPGYPSSWAFDNKTDTTWGSGQTGKNVAGASYIGYDFGSGNARHIRKISILQGGAIPRVKIQRSDDLNNWKEVTILNLSPESGKHYYDLPESGASRYWKILADSYASEGPAAWTVIEIEMKELKKR